MRRTVAHSLLALLVAACTGSPVADPTTTTPDTSPATSTSSTTTTSSPSTTTTTTTPPTALEALGYPVSDDWVVETVVADLDLGTGGLAVDADGVIYHADFGSPNSDGNTVYRIQPDGTVEPWATSELMDNLTMTTFGPDGRLYQSSYGSDRVFRIGDDGSVEVLVEGIRGPTGLVVADDGTLFVEAFDRGDVNRVTPDGEITEFATDGDFRGINGLTVGPDGTLYVVNFRDGGLFAVDTDGAVTELHRFPKTGAHVAYLDESLFVTSRGGYVVWRYDLATGDVEIIAGDAEPGDADGRGPESSFGRPNAITVGPDGALYINHAEGSGPSPTTIRRITYDPVG